MTEDGLSALQGRIRQRSSMRLPPAHPRPPIPPPPASVEPVPPLKPAPRRKRATPPAPIADNHHSVYLDDAQERWIRQVELEALQHGERIGASTVLRAALDLLMSSGKEWTDLRPYARHRGPRATRRT